MFDIPFATLLPFVGLVVAISLAPGPNVLFVMTQSAWRGPRAGFAAATGIETANALYVLFSAIGLAGLIAASGTAFAIIKWAGAAYLAWLGYQAIRASFRSGGSSPVGKGAAAKRSWRDGLMVGLGNPKTILFFLALFPQFIDAGRPVWSQALALGSLAIIIDFGAQALYALAGAALARALSKAAVKRWFERGVGGAFIGLAAVTAMASRS